MNCKDCPYNLFSKELGYKCCQFGSVEERGFHTPCEPTECIKCKSCEVNI